MEVPLRIHFRDDVFKAVGKNTQHLLIVFKRTAVSDLAQVLEFLQVTGVRIRADKLAVLEKVAAAGKWENWADQVLVLERNFPLEVLAEAIWGLVDTIEELPAVPTDVQRLLMGADVNPGNIQFSSDPDLPNVFAVLEERAASPDYLLDRARIIFEGMKNGPLSDHRS